MTDRLAELVAALPRSPGVYLFKDNRGRVVYVGKAKDLRVRVRQYLSGTDGRVQVPFLMRVVVDVDVTEVDTEKEALILENTLIKKHRPRYNVLQRDDTSFLHLRIDPSSSWPRFEVVRSLSGTGKHFGPYSSAHRARRTLEYLGRRFSLRTCSDAELARRSRPCLLYEMHRCLAPCVDRCTSAEYEDIVEESILFLEGRNSELLKRLESRMALASSMERYEEAAKTRDLIRAIEASIESQVVVDLSRGFRDCWSMARAGDRAMAVLLPVRGGSMQEARRFPMDGRMGTDAALLSTLLNTFYEPGAEIPPEVLLDQQPDQAQALAEVLSDRRGSRVQIKVPQRGDKRKVVALARKNAVGALDRSISRDDARNAALDRLQEVARLPHRPVRIECFDNSNIQGSDPVASMVVFLDGVPHKPAYRRYKVKTVQGPDDYATMREILGRRVRRALSEKAKSEDDLPDLIVVDGGKGQVSVVLAVLSDLGVHDVPVIGLAKPRRERARGDRFAVDKIVVPGIKEPQRLRSGDPALRLLQALRDESHRTAVRYHRWTRRKRNLSSVLDSIPGVGPGRRTALLVHFGSVKGVRAATEAEIGGVPGIGPTLAGVIRAALD